MRPISKTAALACALTLGGLSALGNLGVAGAQDEPKPAKSARGGALAKTTRHQFEVFFYTNGLRVFPLDSAGSALDASKLSGTATFYHPSSPKPWFLRPLHATAAGPGQAPISLELNLGLGNVPATGAKVTFEITDPSGDEHTATFTVPVEFVRARSEPVASIPVAPSGVAVPSPRYVYGPGYNGYGYYQFAGPETAPAKLSGPTIYGYSTPSHQGSSGGTVGAGHRDWSTGRDNGLAKPWMKSMD